MLVFNDMARRRVTDLIEKRRGSGGESAYVGRSRIRVADVVQAAKLTPSPLAIGSVQTALPSLSAEEVKGALAYYESHQQQIDDEICRDEALLGLILELA